MESENSLSQNDNDAIDESDSSLSSSIEDLLTDRINTLAQFLTLLGNKILLGEQQAIEMQSQINNINDRLEILSKRVNGMSQDALDYRGPDGTFNSTATIRICSTFAPAS